MSLPLYMHENEDGFSVLEAIIAVVILATAFLPLLDLQMQFAKNAQALEHAQIRSATERKVISALDGVNFALTPKGSVDLGDARLDWSTRPYRAPFQTARPSSRFSTELYEVFVTISGPQAEILHEFQIFGVGWQPKVAFENSIF